MNTGTKSWIFKPGEVSVIQVETDSGPIKLEVAVGPVLKAEAIGDYVPGDSEITALLENRKLTLSARGKKRWFWGGSSCGAGFRVTAPAGKKLIIKTGMGHAEAGAFNAGAEIHSGAGRVALSGLSGPIRIASGAGAITGEIYSEDLEAKSGAGTLDLAWTRAPKAGSASIMSGAGKIKLTFPADSRMRITQASGMGEFHSEIKSEVSAPFALDIKGLLQSEWVFSC